MLGQRQNDWMTELFGYDLESFLEIPARFSGLQASCPVAEAFRSYRWGRMLQRHHLPVQSPTVGVSPRDAHPLLLTA